MRRILAIGFVMALVSACTSLSDLASGRPTGDDDAGDDAAADTGAAASDAAADVPADATPLFVDSFDDGAPLPRQWGAAAGSVAVVASATAPSPGSVLVARSVTPQHAVAFLRKIIATPGKTELSCRFKVRLQNYGGFFQLTTAELEGSGTTYVRFDLTPAEWTAYGQQTGSPPDFTERRNGNFRDVWLDVTLTLRSAGKAIVRVGGDVAEMNVLPFQTEQLVFTLGIERVPTEAFDYEVAYDDVSCNAQ
jgi:hypothetical protein